MKKILAALLVIAIIASLAGCGVFKNALGKLGSKTDEPASSSGEPSDEPSGGKKTDKPPKNTSKPSAELSSEPEPEPSAEPLTPEEEFYRSMLGDYRFIQIGLGGDSWGATWLYEEQRLEEERIAATEPTVSLRADGTGTLVFDDERHDFTWDFDEAEINYVKETGLPGSYAGAFRLDNGEEILFSFSRRILTYEYKDWISVDTTMTEAEYEAYQASFDDLPEGDYTLGEPRIFNAVDSGGYVVQKVLIPVYSGIETVYLRDLHLVVRDKDGTVVYDRTCYGRNPEVLRPGEDGAFIEWVSSSYFLNGYTSLSPDMTVELDDIVITPMKEEYIHRLPLSNVYYDKANGCVRGTVHNDTGDFIAGLLNNNEKWATAHYSYTTHISCYDANGALIYSNEFYDTECLEADQTLDFSVYIYWLPEGYTYDDIDSVRVWSYILDYEYTEKR